LVRVQTVASSAVAIVGRLAAIAASGRRSLSGGDGAL